MSKNITMKQTGVTNPAKAGFVSFSSNSSDFGTYLRKVSAIRNLDVKEERELALRAKQGDLDAKRVLIQSNLKLVLTIALPGITIFLIGHIENAYLPISNKLFPSVTSSKDLQS